MNQIKFPSKSYANPTLASMWEAYQQSAPAGDEIWNRPGAPRAGWNRFFETVGHLDRERLERLEATAARFFREHGATFHMHAGRDDAARPWELDPIPFVIEASEWSQIEAGLRQRVHLLNLIFTDLYGPQHLISSGLLPQDLVLRHPDFLRPCANLGPPAATRLFTYAADLARGPGGAMWVVNDRTGCPPGMGYALENRTIMAQLFPNEFRQLGVQRLSHSFRGMRAGLQALVPAHLHHNPRIVLQTPGPYSPSYFEHAYLAAYLGYTLVQGEDLLVRDGGLWLKALDGLQPVSVLIRRVNDDYCDPLELKADSMLGVAGLLEAARRGLVNIANPVGSQFLENPGLFPFLQNIAREWMGEDLILPHAATWWCGHPNERQHVLANLESLVVKSIDRSPIRMGDQWVYAPFPPGPELEAAIGLNPWRYVGQERVNFSTSPVLANGAFLESRVSTLRTFVTDTGNGYQALPGGLVRCGSLEQTYLPSKPFGGICKDAWVLSDQQETFDSLWIERHEEDRQLPFHGLFTSSAAENLFWTGRYGERARSLIHTLRVVLNQREPDATPGGPDSLTCNAALWRGLLAQAGPLNGEEGEEPPGPTLPFVLDLIQNEEAPGGGLLTSLQSFCRSAFSVRENWSKDTWRIIVRIRELPPPDPEPGADQRVTRVQAYLDDLLLLFQAFAGQSIENMTRTPGWQFLNLGRHIERAMMMSDFMAGVLSAPLTDSEFGDTLETLLEVHENLITYRRAYRTTPEYPTVMHLLYAQPTNPRALIYLLTSISTGLTALADATGHAATRAQSDLVGGVIASIAALPEPAWRSNSDDLLQLTHQAQTVLSAAGEAISHGHFKHATQRPQFVDWNHRHLPGEETK